VSSGAAVAGIGLGLLVSVRSRSRSRVILHGRLARSAVGELLVELREGARRLICRRPPRTLGDPSLELARRDQGGPVLSTRGGRSTARRRRRSVSTPILHQGVAVGALVHDRSLRLRPELLDAVGAAPASRSRTAARSRRCSAPSGAAAPRRQQAALRRVATLVAADVRRRRLPEP